MSKLPQRLSDLIERLQEIEAIYGNMEILDGKVEITQQWVGMTEFKATWIVYHGEEESQGSAPPPGDGDGAALGPDEARPKRVRALRLPALRKRRRST